MPAKKTSAAKSVTGVASTAVRTLNRPPAERKLSMLAVGCLVNQSAIPTAKFRSNTTFLDFEIVVWDPQSTVSEYRPVETYQGLPCLGTDASPQFMRDRKRRRDEMVHMLELGRTIVVLAPEPQVIYIYTGESTTSGTGRNAKVTNMVTERDVLGALPFKMTIVAAQGKHAEVRAGEPFRSFWTTTMAKYLQYRAYFEVPNGVPLLAIQGTDRMVACLLRVARGFVLLLPAPYWGSNEVNENAKAAEAAELAAVNGIRSVVEALRLETGDFNLPSWSEAYALPGEAGKRADIAACEAERDRLLQQLDERKSVVAVMEQKKVLIAGSGIALEEQAKKAFRALGFEVTDGAPGRDDFIATRGEQVAVVEVKGVTKSAAEKHAAQLEKWVSGHYAEHGRQPKGILIVNAYADTPVVDRMAISFPDQMIPYATERRHALVTGLQLLGAWLDVEAHPAKAHEVADSLLAAVGPWDCYSDWRSFLDEGTTAAPAEDEAPGDDA